jgi:mono/diheme cytochrome c family protein
MTSLAPVLLLALAASADPITGLADPSGAVAPATNPLSGDAAAIAEGRSWYIAVCSNCHGGAADGQGRGHAPSLRTFGKGFRLFVETVKAGRDVPGRTAKMPAWGTVLSDQQIYQIGAYLETLAEEGANWGSPRP